MKRQIKKTSISLFYILVVLYKTSSAFTPELVLGNRSIFYQHRVNATLYKGLSFNNISQIDGEYSTNKNNIYFIRNTLSLKIDKHFSVNASYGLKNPGSFSTLFLNYTFLRKEFALNYAFGVTLQKGFSLEHSFNIENNFKLTNAYQLNTRFQALVNHTKSEYFRGFQQVRIGVKRNNIIIGFAANYDQFNNNSKVLSNYGFYIKQIIKY